MTVIAWDGRFVAADSLATRGASRTHNHAQKLRRVGATVYALCGTAALFNPMVEWVEKGAKPEDRPVFAESDTRTTLIAFRDNRCWVYQIETPYPLEHFAPDSWGCAADHVLGAMDHGISAEVAVRKAIEREVYIGGPVQVIDLRPPAPASKALRLAAKKALSDGQWTKARL